MAEFFTNPKLEALIEDRICGSFHNFCFQLLNMIDIVVRLFLKSKLFSGTDLVVSRKKKDANNSIGTFSQQIPLL